jgi:hypothetical protein
LWNWGEEVRTLLEGKALLVESRKGGRGKGLLGVVMEMQKVSKEVKVVYFMGWGRWIMSYE